MTLDWRARKHTHTRTDKQLPLVQMKIREEVHVNPLVRSATGRGLSRFHSVYARYGLAETRAYVVCLL